jgi:hypothetical protein
VCRVTWTNKRLQKGKFDGKGYGTNMWAGDKCCIFLCRLCLWIALVSSLTFS